MKASLTPQGLRLGSRIYPCSIGRGGLSRDKREGDGATPVARMRVAELWYRPDRMAQPAPWARAIGPRDLWCDAPDHPDYNHHTRAPFPASHESLRRADPLYDLVFVLNWNWPQARPGAGSAIFLHQWRRPRFPTEGCLALRRDHLHGLARALPPGSVIEVPALA
ncbi:MAG: L,D-transpeptidase family protein [Rhodobacteraceae bacterium]|nr:L,D-transpeptidase family protein [Paracoccaceae bacterium]MBR9821462.1 L,D-transpeptidase family protein [Paracoccaceae bacterium]